MGEEGGRGGGKSGGGEEGGKGEGREREEGGCRLEMGGGSECISIPDRKASS